MTLERVALPQFHAAAAAVSRDYPGHQVRVWSHAIGAATSYQGWDAGIECVVGDATRDERHVASVLVGFGHLGTSTPRIQAYVDGPNGTIFDVFPETTHARFPDEGTLLNATSWAKVVESLSFMLAGRAHEKCLS